MSQNEQGSPKSIEKSCNEEKEEMKATNEVTSTENQWGSSFQQAWDSSRERLSSFISPVLSGMQQSFPPKILPKIDMLEVLKKQLEEQELEDEKSAEEINKKRDEQLLEKRSRIEQEVLGVEKLQNEHTKRVEEMKFYNQKRLDELKEYMKSRLEQKDEEMRKTIEEDLMENLKEQEAMETEMKRMQQDQLLKLGVIAEQIEVKQEKHKEKLDEMQKKAKQERQTYRETMRKIYREIDLKTIEARKKHHRRMEELEEMGSRVQSQTKNRVWNEIIENNWTERLNLLRDSIKKVDSYYHKFEKAAFCLRRQSKKTKEQKEAETISGEFVDALRKEHQFLNEELEDLENLLQQSGKNFLRTIIKSVLLVDHYCENLIITTKMFLEALQENKLENSYVVLEVFLSEMRQKFWHLKNGFSKIPSIAELKQQFHDDMKSQENNQTRDVCIPEKDPEQTMVIEELDE